MTARPTIKATIAKALETQAPNAEHIADTTVWDYHNVRQSLATNKLHGNSNLSHLLTNQSPAVYLVAVGAKGRTAHSPTALHVYRLPNVSTADSLVMPCAFFVYDTRTHKNRQYAEPSA